MSVCLVIFSNKMKILEKDATDKMRMLDGKKRIKNWCGTLTVSQFTEQKWWVLAWIWRCSVRIWTEHAYDSNFCEIALTHSENEKNGTRNQIPEWTRINVGQLITMQKCNIHFVCATRPISISIRIMTRDRFTRAWISILTGRIVAKRTTSSSSSSSIFFFIFTFLRWKFLFKHCVVLLSIGGKWEATKKTIPTKQRSAGKYAKIQEQKLKF